METPRHDTPEDIRKQNEIAEYLFGLAARRNGQPNDESKSVAWQRGWAAGQEPACDIS